MENTNNCYFLDEKYDCKLRKLRSDKPRNPCVAARLDKNESGSEYLIFREEVAKDCICYTTDETLARQLEGMFKRVPFEGSNPR